MTLDSLDSKGYFHHSHQKIFSPALHNPSTLLCPEEMLLLTPFPPSPNLNSFTQTANSAFCAFFLRAEFPNPVLSLYCPPWCSIFPPFDRTTRLPLDNSGRRGNNERATDVREHDEAHFPVRLVELAFPPTSVHQSGNPLPPSSDVKFLLSSMSV